MRHEDGSRDEKHRYLEGLRRPRDAAAHHLDASGNIPNNPECPLLIYRQAVDLPEHDPAATFEALFAENDWCESWRNGIYGFHHYHSTAHEVLGIYAGHATIQLGGDDGLIVEVNAGDAVVIPAGVGHKNLGSSPDFGVVGAYPAGRQWDMNYGKSGERPRADENIARVPRPDHDPLYGKNGPLIKHW